MPTFDGSYSSNVKAWRKELDAFFRLHPVAEEEVVKIAALLLLDEANDWWFGHMEHGKVTKYLYFFHKLRMKFNGRKPEMCHKETFPKETKEDVILVTLGKESLHSPPTVEVLASEEETLATFQDSLEILTHRVPCMIQEMHEGKEEDSIAGTLG